MPRKAYLAIADNGNLELLTSDDGYSPLSPIGPRFLRGNSFPASLYEFHDPKNPPSPELAIKALKDANAFFAGEIAGTGNLEFGDVARKRFK